MDSIITKDCPVYFNELGNKELSLFISQSKPSKIIILVDTNTREHCLKKFLSKSNLSRKIEVIEIEAGEEYKTIDTCLRIWEELSDLGADRKSLIINLGGGVITDLGGFVANTFRRGINYINVPTSLLAMVDASIGGKTGVDLGSLKNQIGVISSGKMVLIDTDYLNTLPENHVRSGMAEMLKHGLIFSHDYWLQMLDVKISNILGFDNLIYQSVDIKNKIVTEDPLEHGVRKTLNFGHTLGHAIESFYLENYPEDALLHGEAIGIGMILEAHVSVDLLNMPKEELESITNGFLKLFDLKEIEKDHQDAIIELLKFDKKNSHGRINFVLLDKIGKPRIDCQVENEMIYDAFKFYNKRL